MEEIYTIEVIFSLARIGFCVFVFYGFLATLLNPETKNEPFENKLVYKWTNFSGFVIVSVLALSLLNLYDFFGIIIVMASVLFLMSLLNNQSQIQQQGKAGASRSDHYEGGGKKGKRFLIWQLELIEKVKALWSSDAQAEGPNLRPRLMKISETDNWWKYSVIMVGLLGGGLRLYPVLMNPVPSNSNWFFVVQKVKNIRLQQLFADIPEPPGFYALISFISSIAQVKPEVLVYFVEVLLVLPVCFVIYWVLRKAIRSETSEAVAHYAALFGMGVYAVVPVLVMQDSLVQNIYQSKINLALCLAVPAVYGFRNFNKNRILKKLYFWGLIATVLTDLFVFINFLLPALLAIALYSIYQEEDKGKMIKPGLWLASVTLIAGISVVIIVYFGLDYNEFFLWQLFNPEIYDTYSAFLEENSLLIHAYLIAGVGGMLGYFIHLYRSSTKKVAEFILISAFTALLLIYHPYTDINPEWIDPRQLFYVFSIFVAFAWGIIFLNILRLGRWMFTLSSKAKRNLVLPACLFLISVLAFTQYNLADYSKPSPAIPEGFFNSYYNITEDRVPYSYTIVAPTVMQTMAQNRNNFIEYNFFLNNFATYDSLYHQAISESDDPIEEIQFDYRPSPSVFIFLAKSPFNFQTSNINNVESVMQRLDEWIQDYQNREGREISEYYESEDAIIYELTYETGSSQIDETLYEVYTGKPWPMFED